MRYALLTHNVGGTMPRIRICRRSICRAWTVASVALVVAFAATHPSHAHDAVTDPAREKCALSPPSPPRAVVRVIDGATLLLDDGTRVRLIGALAPQPRDVAAPVATNASAGAPPESPNSTNEDWQPAAAAHRALAALVEGRNVTLAYAGRQRDRHGQLLAHVFAAQPSGGAVWLQGALLAAGQARAYGIPDNYACIDALLAAEAPARAAGLGLWANRAYEIRSARRTRTLLALRGTYQLVSGQVVAAKRVKAGRIYLNFGSNWQWDFSVSVPSSLARANADWASTILGLEGRKVLVRGWITRRNGPMIEIEHPGQIEWDAASPNAQQTPPATTTDEDSNASERTE